MKLTEKLIQTIKRSKNIVILAHVGPDGDTLGSMLGLKDILKQLDNREKIDVVIVGKVPDIYRFLPGSNFIRNPDDRDLYQSYDLAITVDCASLDRLGDSVDLFRNAKITANIDHHISNTKFADINLIISDASACGEILYRLIGDLNINLTKEIATNLYTAMLTDTGGFKFENTKPNTLEVCAKLIEAGANPSQIYKECYESKPIAMVRLHARALDQAIFTENYKIAYTSVTRLLLNAFGSTDDHVDGISESLRQVNTVEVAMLFKETQKGDTKVSFRSKRVDVCEVARFFGGGGHKLAAGCTVQKNIADSINEVLPIIRKQINK